MELEIDDAWELAFSATHQACAAFSDLFVLKASKRQWLTAEGRMRGDMPARDCYTHGEWHLVPC